jgi:hypothetical protein
MRTVQLSELFHPKQLSEMSVVIANAGLDSIDQVKALKKYLAGHAKMLESQGIVPDYLAYAIIYERATGDEHPTPSNLTKHFGAAATPKVKPGRKKGRNAK